MQSLCVCDERACASSRQVEACTHTNSSSRPGQPDQRCAGEGSSTSLLVLRGMMRRGDMGKANKANASRQAMCLPSLGAQPGWLTGSPLASSTREEA